ncbi:MAG: hypothetical protein V4654_03215 [Bdellovibrionota bacterium]
MGRGFIVFLFGVMGVLSLHASECAKALGTCEYYQCLEKQENCGKDGYYIKFGVHYCRKYQAEQSEYTARGQEFLDNIRVCLQEELEREHQRAGELPKCSKVKKFAVETHKHCYSENNFCSLPKTDQYHVKLAAKKEIFDFQMLRFAFWLEKSCF